jgi:hypothetical protein
MAWTLLRKGEKKNNPYKITKTLMSLNPYKYYAKRYRDGNLNSQQLAKMMNKWPPAISNRIKIVGITDDFMNAKMMITRSWLNSAQDQIMFGGTTYSGMDMYYGMALPLIMKKWGIDSYAFTKEAKIEYIKPVTTDLTVLFKLTDKTIEDYKNGLEKSKKHEEWLTVEGYNEEKELCVRTELLMYLRTWPRRQKDENRD